MRKHEIESWALSIIDQVRSGQPVEDARVELKAEWPDVQKAARRIAGHANAARGDYILWLIGVDESSGVNGVPHLEMATWWPQVEALFDGLSPSVVDVNITVDGQTVVALLFHTDRAPFVYKSQGSGHATLEVPWRGSTSIRSARRDELIRILSPLQQLPKIEVINANLHHGNFMGAKAKWQLTMDLYALPRTERIVIPYHRCVGSVQLEGTDIVGEIEVYEIRAYSLIKAGKSAVNPSKTVTFSDNELIMIGPGKLSFMAWINLPTDLSPVGENARLALRLYEAYADDFVILSIRLTSSKDANGKYFWYLKNDA